jgi:NAD(P)-dependent dehydrogenase (short-subunit alcohol dehydrogenase family)
MTRLREQLLDGRAVALDGAELAEVRSRLAGLGARVEVLPGRSAEGDSLAAWVGAARPLDALVVGCGEAFAGGGAGALQAALGRVWAVVHAVATGAMIEGGGEGGGKIVFVAPRPGSGELAEALTAGLESLARTLSVEWARYRITACAVAPGASVGDGELAELIGFLVSVAGDYFSGCRFDLGRSAASGSAAPPADPLIRSS